MRNLLKLLLVIAMAFPIAAQAQILNSPHDLSNVSTATVHNDPTAANTTNQTCKFCHTPHQASTPSLLWAHTLGTSAATFTGQTTAGTLIGSQTNNPTPHTKHCLDCHDGTVAVGSLTIGGTTAVYGMTGGVVVMPTAFVVATAGAGGLNTNHPVGIPYAGQTTYNGVVSGVPTASVGVDYTALNTTCATSTTGICVGTAGGPGQYIAIAKPGTSGTAGDTGYGIECFTCHEPHGKYSVTPGYAYFLRGDPSSSNLCKACHIK